MYWSTLTPHIHCTQRSLLRACISPVHKPGKVRSRALLRCNPQYMCTCRYDWLQFVLWLKNPGTDRKMSWHAIPRRCLPRTGGRSPRRSRLCKIPAGTGCSPVPWTSKFRLGSYNPHRIRTQQILPASSKSVHRTDKRHCQHRLQPLKRFPRRIENMQFDPRHLQV